MRRVLSRVCPDYFSGIIYSIMWDVHFFLERVSYMPDRFVVNNLGLQLHAV
jgi:hypothetical protein